MSPSSPISFPQFARTRHLSPRYTRTLFAAACAILLIPIALAQTPATPPPSDGIGLTFKTTGSAVEKSKLESGSTHYGEVSSGEFAVSLTQSVPVGDDSHLEVGLGYQLTSLDLKPANDVVPLPERFQSLTLDLSYNQKLSTAWSAFIGTSTGYHTAGSSGFSQKCFGVDVFALGLYTVSPTLQVALGGGYSSLASGRNQFGPALGVSWQATPKWSVAFGYPNTGVTYKYSESLTLGLAAEVTANTYYVERDPLPGTRGKPALDRTTLESFDVRLGLAAKWKINSAFSLVAKIGSVLDRHYDYHERNFKLKTDGTAAYSSLGLSASF